jgi:PAS domain-containing protein
VIVQINDTQLKWHDLTRGEVVGKMRFAELLTTESRKVFQERYPHFWKSGWLRDLELEIARKDGTKLTVLLSANAIKGADGQFVMSRSVLFDIT